MDNVLFFPQLHYTCLLKKKMHSAADCGDAALCDT